MPEHQHTGDCSHHHGPDGTHTAAAPDDEKIPPTPFHLSFRLAAFAGLALCLALMLPLPGGAQTKTILIVLGTVLGIIVFPLAYFKQETK
jgi:hypothetical protein